MTNILDYVVAAPYLHPEPLAMAMYTTGPGWLHGTTGSRFLNLENWINCQKLLFDFFDRPGNVQPASTQ